MIGGVWCKATDLISVRELLLVEEFENCVSERITVYLNEQKVSSLQQAATLADEFALIHKTSIIKHDPHVFPGRSSNVPACRTRRVRHLCLVPRQRGSVSFVSGLVI